jgi:hypothetical protein
LSGTGGNGSSRSTGAAVGAAADRASVGPARGGSQVWTGRGITAREILTALETLGRKAALGKGTEDGRPEADYRLTQVLASSITLVGFVWSRWRVTAGWTPWRAAGLASLGLFAAVATFGAASALSRAAASWQDAHLAMVALLWGFLVADIALLATRGPRREAPATAEQR